ncbi:glycosyltransferase family 2 protein [Frigoribacterium sp. CFBP 8754]|jgi:N-acetylglucosaminyl-diphospho-decaprenol L-rhamnosyltransferase|uniref:glycosyltransferase family 2 protein n=1 Tax=unclassified Frigoribacterium TaxID=2627005 RepID=UPI00178562C7|nr:MULTISPECIES: glycosyltransferase family 2 protein [unclassified Frigoribacterium]MBD8658997.1 glycosyltransferase family 2 protein [Frigoribacterium sp. CFBP 8754]MBD8727292.1 glycosyltransferase family 2 protein [Frigoribacterium sp. CFBP 13707]
MSTDVAIVTVSYNSGRYLDEFLASTAAASASGPVTVVVADNDSDDVDGLASTTTARGAEFVALGENLGYGGAVNAAVRRLRPECRWILISNPDVVMEPGSLDVLVAAAEGDDSVGAVGPAIIEPDGSVYPSARRVPSLRTGLGHALLANVWPDNPWTREYHLDGAHDARRTTGWLSGACLLVRRSAFDALGGFDDSFFMYFEDVDLGYRLGRAGWTNVYEPSARVMHVGAHSTQNSSRQMRLVHHRSAYRFLAAKYHGWYLWPLRAALRVALSVRGRARSPRP